MNGQQRSPAALGERLLELRDPLCRAELAASLLERDCATGPSEPRSLVRELRDAISDVDARIDAMVATLRQRAPDDARETLDASDVVDAVLRRMRPVLAARNVEAVLGPASHWIDACDAVRLRRALLVSLRAALAALPAGGCIELTIESEPEALGLRSRPVGGHPDNAHVGFLSEDVLHPVRGMASGLGGRIDVGEHTGERVGSFCVWLPRQTETGDVPDASP